MSFDQKYDFFLDRHAAMGLVVDFSNERMAFVESKMTCVTGNATIRPNQKSTSSKDFGVLDFYIDGTGVHVSTMLPEADYGRLLVNGAPNELRTRFFVTPEGQADIGCIRETRSETSIGEIIDIEFALTVDSPSPSGQAATLPIEIRFGIDHFAAQSAAAHALSVAHQRRFMLADPSTAHGGWVIDVLSTSKEFDRLGVYCALVGPAHREDASARGLPDALKDKELHAVRSDDARFTLVKFADPAYANELLGELLAAKNPAPEVLETDAPE